jgi:hypothetical protein
MSDKKYFFEKNQDDLKLEIYLTDGYGDISEKTFKKDMKNLTNKIILSDVNKETIIMNAKVRIAKEYKESGKEIPREKEGRYYDLESNFEGANISIDTLGKRIGREKLIYSNRVETQLRIRKTYFTIFHENWDNK